MNKIVFALIAIVGLTSCADSYNIQGASSISSLEGSKLYLKAFKDKEMKNIDSCDVIHGKFRFAGLLDTVRMASLFMGEESIMPVVVEKGEIEIKIDNASQKVTGTPLNEKLYDFITFHNQLNNEMNELSHKQSQMLLEGIDEDAINRQLSVEAAAIAQREDSLVTTFIVENFDNVLGPGVFMIMTSSYPYPVLTPQIEDIMSKATQHFKDDAYVKEYYQVANEIQARQNGLVEEATPQANQQTAPQAQPGIGSPQANTDSLHVPLTNAPEP